MINILKALIFILSIAILLFVVINGLRGPINNNKLAYYIKCDNGIATAVKYDSEPIILHFGGNPLECIIN